MEGYVKLKWFEFNQNNSGGYYNEDENQAPVVWIQAASATEAWAKAEGMFDFDYCPCCGERWDEPWDDDGTDEPMYYGQTLGVAKPWVSHGILHYYDGRKERVDFK